MKPGLTNLFFSKPLPLLSAGSFSLNFMVCSDLRLDFFVPEKRRKKEKAIRPLLSQMGDIPMMTTQAAPKTLH